MFILNAISSKNTHHNFETFDGVKLKYTNWRFEPISRDGIVFAYENDEPFFMGKFLYAVAHSLGPQIPYMYFIRFGIRQF